MSQANIWSWRHAILRSDLPPTTRHVLLTIACFMNDVGGGCYPTTKTLAEATGLSERAVCTHILSVAASENRPNPAAWLYVTKHGLKGQKWKNHQYEARWPERKGTEVGSVASDAKALNLTQKGTEPDDRKVLKEVQCNPPVNPSSDSERECARAKSPRNDDNDVKQSFDTAFRSWPTCLADSADQAFAVWVDLKLEERSEAADEIARYIAVVKSVGRSKTCSFGRYLREKRWLRLPARRRDAPIKDQGEPSTGAASRPLPSLFQRQHPELYPELISGQKMG